MPNFWNLITGPLWKILAVLLVGVFIGWRASDWMIVNGLQKDLAKCEAAKERSEEQVKASFNQMLLTEEQCQSLREWKANEPKPVDRKNIDPSVLERLRGGVWQDGGKSDSPARPEKQSSGAEAPKAGTVGR